MPSPRARRTRVRARFANAWKAVDGANATALAAKVDALAPAKPDSDANEPRGRRAAKSEGAPTLESVGNELMAAAMAMQGADIAPTANQIAACRRASASYHAVMAQWSALEKESRSAAGRELSGRLPVEPVRHLHEEGVVRVQVEQTVVVAAERVVAGDRQVALALLRPDEEECGARDDTPSARPRSTGTASR